MENIIKNFLNLKGEIKMETMEIMTNNEVIETAEEIVNAGSGKAMKVAGVIGLATLGGIFTYKFVVKPITTKLKARKNENCEPDEVEDVDYDEVDNENDE